MSIFVCDNLSFSGEVKIARKHTRFINRDLPQLVSRAVGMLGDKWNQQDRRITVYKGHVLNDQAVHDLVIRSVDVGVCANSYIPDLLKQWREPQHEAFEARNVWSLFNAFTGDSQAGSEPGRRLPKRTLALHGLLDVAVGLNCKKERVSILFETAFLCLHRSLL